MAIPKRVILIVLDSVGIGALPDAHDYGDTGAATLQHIAQHSGGLYLPAMNQLGLGAIAPIEGCDPGDCRRGAYGKMAERSRGKDTITGHWEMVGIVLDEPFRTFPDGFPEALIQRFERETGRKTLGNKAISGTVILDELGQRHMETGSPIVYTSADSVFQIATHEDIIPLEELYRYCAIARTICQGEYLVGRIIARPFVGRPGDFKRTSGRKDYAVAPPSPSILEDIEAAGLPVVGVGKIEDIFQQKGITHARHTTSNGDGMAKTLECLADFPEGLIFVNLVDFDMKFGHRLDVAGYKNALSEFDAWLPTLLKATGENDLVIITADHGCDPTTPGTDHSREYVPLLVWSPKIDRCIDLGIRGSFADIAETLAQFLLNRDTKYGQSFLSELHISSF